MGVVDCFGGRGGSMIAPSFYEIQDQCNCVFLSTGQYNLPKLLGGGVLTSGSGYSVT